MLMRTIDVALLHDMFMNAAELVIENEPYLTEIDTIIGDGDHGTGMKRGCIAVRKLLSENSYESLPMLCRAVSIELIRSMGGASGVIFGTMFFGGIGKLPDAKEADAKAIASYFMEGEKSIEIRGKSRPGQKTMLDALYPAVTAMKEYKGDDILELFEAAYLGAAKGVEESKDMLSKKGRSSNFGDECLGIPDPGAVSTSLLFKAFYETINSRIDERKS